MHVQLPTSHVTANERTNERKTKEEKNVCLIQRSRVDKRQTDSDVFSFVSFHSISISIHFTPTEGKDNDFITDD